ncbi:MAG: hypothetical protein KatS3mg124_1452 [Porticoccaceae bacterium]|nr:MAG: hypothetical protein KatS3mg124_1452 [Porticoccaceae bacterium]
MAGRPFPLVRLRGLWAAALALLLAACAGQVKDGAPRRALDPDAIADAEPRPEPYSRRGNQSPYRVFGKTYHVLPTHRNYRARGIASWYGTAFHGKTTSSGEPYDMYAMTAAHKTLPIPCYVEVTNLENGRRAIVRVNDRGPFVGGRLIDLSWAAARKLGIDQSGTALVEVVAIDPAAWDPRAPRPPLRKEPQVRTFLQVGAFSTAAAAERWRRERVHRTGYPSEVRTAEQGGRRLYKVLVGPFADPGALAEARKALARKAGLSSFVFTE